jgi:hypothetical protein
MYYLVGADHNSMAVHLTRSVVCERVYRSAVRPTAVDGTDDNMLWNGSEEDGSVRSVRKKDEGTDCDDEESDTEW